MSKIAGRESPWLHGIPLDFRTELMERWLRGDFERKKKKLFREKRCRNRFRVLGMDQIRGLPLAGPSTGNAGVYFLWNGPQLVYIGQSASVHSRLAEHRRLKRAFSHATFESLNPVNLLWAESQYIKRYKPPLNIRGIG